MSPMAGNKFDAFLSSLANNRAFYEQFIAAVEAEKVDAKEALNASAVDALFHPDETSLACGRWGIYNAWDDILARAKRAQHK